MTSSQSHDVYNSTGVTRVSKLLDFRGLRSPPVVLQFSHPALDGASDVLCLVQKFFLSASIRCWISVSLSSNQSWCFFVLKPMIYLMVLRIVVFRVSQCPSTSSEYCFGSRSCREFLRCVLLISLSVFWILLVHQSDCHYGADQVVVSPALISPGLVILNPDNHSTWIGAFKMFWPYCSGG